MPGAQLGLNARLYIGSVFTPGTAPDDATEWNDAQFLVLSDAFMDNTQLWALVLDKELGVSGTTATGLMAWMEVVGFVRNEQLTEGITVDFSLKPAYNLTLPPEWRTIVTA